MRTGLIAIAFALWSPEFATAQETVDDEVSSEYETDLDKLPSGALVEAFTKNEFTSNDDARPLLPLGLELIKDFEGWREKPYNDAKGYCTIGYGHLIDLKSCETTALLGDFANGLTREEGLVLLEKDTTSSRLAVQKLVTVPLTAEQFGALTSFTFNFGPTKFGKSSLLKRTNEKKFDPAALEFAKWVKAGPNILTGLVTRRTCETLLFKGTLKPNAQQKFDRDMCTASAMGAADVGDLIDTEVGE